MSPPLINAAIVIGGPIVVLVITRAILVNIIAAGVAKGIQRAKGL